jgi:hypothetical protein
MSLKVECFDPLAMVERVGWMGAGLVGFGWRFGVGLRLDGNQSTRDWANVISVLNE